MKASCDVIRDLLPLYAENLASKDTCALLRSTWRAVRDAKPNWSK